MSDTILLSIDCATEECSVALGHEDKCLAEEVADLPMSHTSKLTTLIDEALGKGGVHRSELSGVICNMGPGSYTGLRVGLSTAKALCYGLDIPLIGISSLEGIARLAKDHLKDVVFDSVVPMIDARRMEVYYAVFNKQGDYLHQDSNLVVNHESLRNLEHQFGRCVFVGPGPEKVTNVDGTLVSRVKVYPSRARGFIEPGLRSWLEQKFEDLAYSEPNYLKPPNITIPRKTLF